MDKCDDGVGDAAARAFEARGKAEGTGDINASGEDPEGV